MSKVAVVTAEGASYPAAGSSYGPAEPYPEYHYSPTSGSANTPYSMVRRLLLDARLDAERAGSVDWNPLGAYISPGSNVFVLCNFVYHRRPSESDAAFWAKCIHGSVLRPILDYALLAAGPSGRVRFGNAALQSCDWHAVLRDTGAQAVADFYRAVGAPVEARDLRLFVSRRSGLGHIKGAERRDGASHREVDLGSKSLLDAAVPAGSQVRYRVADYNPARTEAYHRAGSHVYSLSKDILDADVVVSLSKLKTHEKVGITCGLKGFVGVVGHKDCLAHHRYGSPAAGGDEYPSNQRFLEPLSRFQDWVQEHEQPGVGAAGLQIVDRTIRRAVRRSGMTMTGSWHGNDTAWRMALDLARLVYYCDGEGRMQPTAQRRHISFIDGIVGGEGDGPLAPTPAPAGAVVFSDDVAVGDRVAARLMGLPAEKIPVIREAFSLDPYPITDPHQTVAVTLNGTPTAEGDIAPALGRPFRAPRGWRTYLAAAQ